MLPIILNKTFEKLAAVDDYNSFIWTSRYYTTGDFELCVDASVKNMNLFKKDYYVLREDDDNVGIIEKVKIQRNEDGREIMIVSGRFAQSILARRIISPQINVAGKVSGCIEALIYNNLIDPINFQRRINFLTIDPVDINIQMKAQFTGDNLMEAVSKICETYGIGFKVYLNRYVFRFKLYQGKDRTYNQNVNPWVIFSDKYDNLLSSEYEENYQNMANAVWVAGEGEGLDRKNVWVTDGYANGMNRHEIYNDRRDLQSNDGEISPSEYEHLMEESGKENLTKYTTAFTGTVYFDNIKYKEDVNLGDLCVIENSRWGIYLNSRLVEVIESVNEAGEYSIIPTFGI